MRSLGDLLSSARGSKQELYWRLTSPNRCSLALFRVPRADTTWKPRSTRYHGPRYETVPRRSALSNSENPLRLLFWHSCGGGCCVMESSGDDSVVQPDSAPATRQPAALELLSTSSASAKCSGNVGTLSPAALNEKRRMWSNDQDV